MRPSQHWLNVDHGSTVDGFNGADSKASPSDSANDDRVKAEGIWAIGRSGGEYPGDRTAGIGTGMNFQYLAIRLMQPGDDDDLVTWVEAMERVSRECVNFKPCVGCAFGSLHWSILEMFQAGPDYADRAKQCVWPSIKACFFEGSIVFSYPWTFR